MKDKKLEKVTCANENYKDIKSHFISFYKHFADFVEKDDKFGISNAKRCDNKFTFKYLDITFSIEMSLVYLHNEYKGRTTFNKVFIENSIEKKETIGTELFIDYRGNMDFGKNKLNVINNHDVKEIAVEWLNEYLKKIYYRIIN